ncbi:MAG: hypothetical protein KJ954_14380 [Alphaproteobacteria bacterium]|nr:hypothetical protein [Alphaproteobacteria bacterium]
MTKFKQAPADSDEIPRGHWHGARLEDGRRACIISCPGCGNYGSLSGHSIAADGTVTPSVVCTVPGCGFHEWIKLEGWSI